MTEAELRRLEDVALFDRVSDSLDVLRLVTEVRNLRAALRRFVDWDEGAEHDPYTLRDAFQVAKEVLGGTEGLPR
jgi:hypothetical protein